jgi:hypothetical protein
VLKICQRVGLMLIGHDEQEISGRAHHMTRPDPIWCFFTIAF